MKLIVEDFVQKMIQSSLNMSLISLGIKLISKAIHILRAKWYYVFTQSKT